MRITVALSIPPGVTAACTAYIVSDGTSRAAPNAFDPIGDEGIWMDLEPNTGNRILYEQKKISFLPFPEVSFVVEKETSARTAEPGLGSSESRTTAEASTDVSHSAAQLKSTSPLVQAARAGKPLQSSALAELASVVKIFVDTVKSDFVSPWQMMAPQEQTG